MSVRWQHCIDHADTKQKPLMRPDCLLGVVPQPTDSRLSETRAVIVDTTSPVAGHVYDVINDGQTNDSDYTVCITTYVY